MSCFDNIDYSKISKLIALIVTSDIENIATFGMNYDRGLLKFAARRLFSSNLILCVYGTGEYTELPLDLFYIAHALTLLSNELLEFSDILSEKSKKDLNISTFSDSVCENYKIELLFPKLPIILSTFEVRFCRIEFNFIILITFTFD
jgi:hypothetical protein